MSAKLNESPQGPFFHGGMFHAIQTFDTRGVDYPQTLLCEEFLKACDHVHHVFEKYGAFWEKLDSSDVNRIDLSDPDTSFYDVVLPKLGIQIGEVSLATYYRRTNLLMVKLSEDIARVMRHFFRYILNQLLRRDPELVKQ